MKYEILHENDKFFTIIDGLESHLQFILQDDNAIVFYHTFVPPELRGKGIAIEIIKAGMDYAAGNNLKVIPTCSIVKTVHVEPGLCDRDLTVRKLQE